MWHYCVLSLAGLIIALLIIPIRYNLTGKKDEEVKPFFKGEVSWFFGLCKFFFLKVAGEKGCSRFKLFGLTLSLRKKKTDKKKEEETTENKMDFRRLFDRKLITQVISSVKRIILHLLPRKFVVEGNIGFDDPFDTFVLFSALNTAFPHPNERFSVNIKPVFDDEIFEAEFLIKGRIVVGYLFYIVLQAALSRPLRDILWSMRNKKEAMSNGIEC